MTTDKGSTSSSQSLPDAIVLAGGHGRRLGGTDKTALDVGGRPILDRVLVALPPCGQVVVVGPERPTAVPVVWTREDPPGGGPVAGLAAGLSVVTSPDVLVLAGDMPFLTPDVLSALREAASRDGALLVDDEGREQYLCSAWRTSALREALVGVSRVRDVVERMSYARVPAPTGVLAPWTDCDTPDDLKAARERA